MFGSINYPHQWSFLVLPLTFIATLFKTLSDFLPVIEKKPPTAPHAIPLLGHGAAFVTSPAKLVSIFAHSPTHGKLLRIKLPFDELWMVNGSSQILTILTNPKIFDFEPMKSMALRNILGLSGPALHSIDVDNSGVSTKPLPGTNIPPENRFNYMERKAISDFARPASHAVFLEQFKSNMYRCIDGCGITSDWIVLPDLHVFVRDILFRATTDAFFGQNLLRLSPHLAQDIWKFDKDVPFFAKGLPAFLKPQAYQARTRCIESFKKWRSFVRQQSSLVDDTSPEWNNISGLRCMTLRNQLFKKFDGWKDDDHACAASDLAVLFGLVSNAVRASFWFLFETLQSEELFEDAIQEVSSALKSPGLPPRFDQKKLLQQPLLQSIYAETLRKYVSVMMVRKTRQPSKLAGYNIPAGKKVIVCNYSEHMDEALWKSETNTSRPSSPPPLTQFWGRRFLTSTPDAPGTPVFAAENIGRKWIPFGSGERMCPGRHFTKHQMLLTFALLTETFDIELLSREGERPEPDLTHFGYGTMGPDRSTPFRIRRKGYPVRRDSGAVVY